MIEKNGLLLISAIDSRIESVNICANSAAQHLDMSLTDLNINASRAYIARINTRFIAGIAQLVEHNLAKVGVASSNLVSRSKSKSLGLTRGFLLKS